MGEAIKLGQTVRDKVSDFQGIVIARTEWLNGCFRDTVQPKVGADGKLPDHQTFDEPQLEALAEGNYVEPPYEPVIKLGQKVKDTVTNFEGVATGRTIWMHDIVRIYVQPTVDKDGKPRDGMSINEKNLVVTGEKITEEERSRKTGGPIPSPSRGEALGL